MRNISKISAFLLCFLLFFNTTVYAQNGKIEGFVFDSQNNEPLPGANVYIDGTSYGAAADLNGKYLIPQVPPGDYKLVVKYIGYVDKTVDLTITAGQTLQKIITLDFQSLEGETIEVSAQAGGQMEAINQQRSNLGVTNIVSADKIREVPDANAAEAVGRLPGVAIKRSSGEGNEVVIRGLSPRMNLVTVNGIRMPSTNENNTAVGLAGISQYMLSGIEVRKSLTAEDDADVVGGIVDLKLATAKLGYHFDAILEGMQNGLTNTYGSYRGSIQGSNRFFDNQLGVIAQVNLERADRPNHNLTAAFSPSIEAGKIKPNVTDINNGVARFDDIVRDRFGANLLLDYKLPDGKIQFNSIYNKLKEDRWERRFNFVTAKAATPTLEKHHHSIYDQNYTLVNGLSLETEIFGMAYLDLGASLTRGVRSGDEYQLNIGYDSALPSPTGSIKYYDKTAYDIFNDIYDPKGNYMIWQLLSKDQKFIENESSFQANLKFPFSIGRMVSGDVKFGGKMRLKDRNYDYNQNGGPIYGGDSDLIKAIVRDNPNFDWPWASANDVPASVPKFPASPLYYPDSSDRVDVLEDKVTLKDFCERKWVDQLAKRADAANWAGLTQKILMAQDLANDYNGNEKFYAGYLMADFNLSSSLTLNAGIRHEYEKTTYQGYGVEEVASQDDNLDTLDAATRRNEFYLPSATLKYTYAEWGDVRFAYYKSLSRPEYYWFIPHYHAIITQEIPSWYPAGNTYLRPSRAHNFDLIFSFYNNYIGFFSVDGFYKEIYDFYYLRSFTVTEITEQRDNNILPYSYHVNPGGAISLYWNNTEPGYVRGLELDWQTHFWYLPVPFNGFVLSANFTGISSQTRYYIADPILEKHYYDKNTDGRISRSEFYETLNDTLINGPLIDQPGNIFNLSVGYDYKDFSIRLAWFYQGSALNYVTNNNTDTHNEPYSRFDLSVSQKLPVEGLSVQVLWNNISSEREREYTQIPKYGSREQYYGSTASIGLRYEL